MAKRDLLPICIAFHKDLSGLRSGFPNADEAELRRRLADLLLGEELARKVYGEISHAK